MNNEPVAWMSVGLDGRTVLATYEFETAIPLYTHPVKELDEQFKKGFEAGKEEGWKAHKFHHPVKELTREDRLKLIGTLKWAEDLLREAGHDEAVSDVQDCLMILRKAQEK